MKFGREIGTGSPDRSIASGSKLGSYGSDGSHRTPK
jgi:hypothetical protein